MVNFEKYLSEQDKGNLGYPDDHKPAMKVPKGGSSCFNCRYWKNDTHLCMNTFYIRWNNGSGKIPEQADSYCSDWYRPI